MDRKENNNEHWDKIEEKTEENNMKKNTKNKIGVMWKECLKVKTATIDNWFILNFGINLSFINNIYWYKFWRIKMIEFACISWKKKNIVNNW